MNKSNNRIIIILTSPSDETIKTTYTLNIERQAALTTEEEGLSDGAVVAIIFGILILGFGGLVLYSRKK